MMYFLFFILLFIFYFFININRKRISPNLANKYVVSPIDGFISGIHLVNLENDKKIYTEIIIKCSKFSIPYLYAPISGSSKVILNEKDSLVIDFSSYDNESIRLYHGWSFLINHFDFPFFKKTNLYIADYFKTSELYGVFYFGHYVKIILNSKNTIVTATGQHVIGGESIMAIISDNETLI